MTDWPAIVADRLSARLLKHSPVSGGCISDAVRIKVQDQAGQVQFLFGKSGRIGMLDAYQTEADGLHALAVASAQSDSLIVPKPVAIGIAGNRAYLILPWLESARPSAEHQSRWGMGLAQVHRFDPKKLDWSLGAGWHRDNTLGATPQNNLAMKDWREFFVHRRLDPLIRQLGIRAEDQSSSRPEGSLAGRLSNVVAKARRVLPETPSQWSLIHGDLWSGNWMSLHDGRVALIDPAVYVGDREAEFGMIDWMGGASDAFLAAYHAEFPLADDWRTRLPFYRLYHSLNHWCLFGGGYRAAVESDVDECLRA